VPIDYARQHDLAPGTPVYWQPTPQWGAAQVQLAFHGTGVCRIRSNLIHAPNEFHLVNASNGQTIMPGDLDLFMSALPDTHARMALVAFKSGETARISREGRIHGIVPERGVVAMHRVVHVTAAFDISPQEWRVLQLEYPRFFRVSDWR
jgi:hypothetical protein